MSALQKLIGVFLRPRVKRLARDRSILEVAGCLEDSRARVELKIDSARDTHGNREAINHIVGIERWGQSRLRVGLGAPLEIDGYREYRLPDDAGLSDLQAAFRCTRDETIELANELAHAEVDPSQLIRHNDLGDLTPVEWLAFLDDHANREIFRIRT